MRRRARILAAVAALALVLGPVIAEARVGGGSSSGSRGSRSSSAPPSTQTAPGGAQRLERTEAPRTPSTTGATTPAAGRPAPTYTPPAANRGGMFGGGFMGGLAGGLLGAGLIGMMFGGGMFGGLSGGAGFLGFLLQIGLIAGLVYLVVRLVRGRRAAVEAGPALAGAGGRMPMVGAAPGSENHARQMDREGGGGGVATVATRPLQVTEADFASFEQTLTQMNAAWSKQDVDGLRRISTPEMARYFEGDLRDLAARGWRNETRDVKLESGDLSEAWSEQGLDYATVAMRFSLVDVTRDAAGLVVEGNPDTRQTVAELWTFVRRPGAAWTVSAIQQTGR